MDVAYDEAKLAELIVYLADRLGDDRFGGATKLNKVLFYADFEHLRSSGKPITGAEYQKLERGPAPRRLLPVRERLVAEGAITVENESLGQRTQSRLRALRPADLSAFSTDELATVDAVVARFRGLTAGEVSDLSHDEAAWRHVEMNAVIPYELAFVPVKQVITPTAERLGQAVAARYGLVDAG